MQPLLSLVMIVKNESRGIRETLLSVKPFVDRWLILDTGSTDETLKIIRETMDGVQGTLAEAPFIDFATTRNQALALAGTECVFTLMLSGDEILKHGDVLRSFCESTRDDKAGAYYLPIEFGETLYSSARLARSDAGWRYVGVTHEVLTKDGELPSRNVPSIVAIYHDLSHRDLESSKKRWEVDKDLLRQNLSPRNIFYLAQTHECLGELDQAFALYSARVVLGGWYEEVYEAAFRKARVAAKLNQSWPEVFQLYSKAIDYAPHRAEAFYQIAKYYSDRGQHTSAHIFVKKACELPFPAGDTLFIDRKLYDFDRWDLLAIVSYYVGDKQAGEQAARKALEKFPDDARLLKNLAFYRNGDSIGS